MPARLKIKNICFVQVYKNEEQVKKEVLYCTGDQATTQKDEWLVIGNAKKYSALLSTSNTGASATTLFLYLLVSSI